MIGRLREQASCRRCRAFDQLALELFALQFQHNAPYRRLCEARGARPGTVAHWTAIPAVPTSAFKEFELSCLPVARADSGLLFQRDHGTAPEQAFPQRRLPGALRDLLAGVVRIPFPIGNRQLAIGYSHPTPCRGATLLAGPHVRDYPTPIQPRRISLLRQGEPRTAPGLSTWRLPSSSCAGPAPADSHCSCWARRSHTCICWITWPERDLRLSSRPGRARSKPAATRAARGVCQRRPCTRSSRSGSAFHRATSSANTA